MIDLSNLYSDLHNNKMYCGKVKIKSCQYILKYIIKNLFQI